MATNLYESFSDTKEYRKYFADALKELKNMPKPPIVNQHLNKHLRQVVNDLVARKYRKAAMEVLTKSSEEIIGEFLYYYHSDSGNVACLVIDRARKILVKKRKIKGRENNWNQHQKQ